MEAAATPQNASAVRKVSETKSMASDELEDTFEIIEKPQSSLKFKNKKPSKLGLRSMSLQTINAGDEDGLKGRKKHQKKNCIQS